MAHDLSPSDTALLLHDRKVSAFVTDAGAKTSHTAIVARELDRGDVGGMAFSGSLPPGAPADGTGRSSL